MHLYRDYALDYIKQGFSVIPDKYGSKLPAIKKWSQYCDTLATEKDYLHWSNSLKESNLAICLGPSSGIIALDLDCTNEQILKIIMPLMPPSPVERKGAKGWVRFFKYTGETSFSLKHEGEVVLEVLSSNKKVTIPPSKHPSGMNYTWKDNISLLDIDRSKLPLLPPYLIPHIESKLRLEKPEMTLDGNKIINGRNDELSSICGKLIHDQLPVGIAIQELIKADEEKHPDNPLFQDENEYQSTERFTNALAFYSNHLMTINGRRFRRNETYEIPMLDTAVNTVHKEELLGKSELPRANLESLKNIELPMPKGVLRSIYDNILLNAPKKQPAFAMAAAIVTVSTLIGRKLTFQGVAPNLYVLNIVESGGGKDAPQKIIKNIFNSVDARELIGASDYVSDAAIIQGLEDISARLDIIDEASKYFKISRSGEHDRKKVEILCELYTSSNDYYAGRMTATEGRKGDCERPNVNLLCSTTPHGFEDSLNESAFEKGLLPRFLIFKGVDNPEFKRIKKKYYMDKKVLDHLAHWVAYQAPKDSKFLIGDMTQTVYDVPYTENADTMLDEVFENYKEVARKSKDTGLLPVISRLYTHVLKLSLIHAASRQTTGIKVHRQDVKFAFDLVNYFFHTVGAHVSDSLVSGYYDINKKSFLTYINQSEEGMSRARLFRQRKARGIKLHEKDAIIKDLEESGLITKEYIDGTIWYKGVKL